VAFPRAGNPGINSDWYYNVNEYAFLTFMYTHALLPQVAYTAAHTACGWSDFLLPSSCSKDFIHPSPACLNATHAAQQYLPTTWDPYNVCENSLSPTFDTKNDHFTKTGSGQTQGKHSKTRAFSQVLVGTCHEDDEGAEEGDNTADDYVSRNTPHLDAMRKAAGLEGKMTYDPCISRQTPLYMKRPDVLKALHAETHPNPVRKTAPPPVPAVFITPYTVPSLPRQIVVF
jgi:hypothetical protein